MRYVTFLLLVATAYVFPAPSLLAEQAEEGEALPETWVQLREQLAGAWQYHGTAGDEKICGVWMALPTAGGHCLRTQETGTADDGSEKRVYVGNGMCSFDPATDKFSNEVFYADGGHLRSVWDAHSNKKRVKAVEGKRESVDPDGNTRTGKVDIDFKDEDGFRYSIGYPEAPLSLEFHRLASFATPDRVPTAKICREFFTKHFAGRWQWSPVEGNQEEPYEWTCRMSQGISCHRCRSLREGQVVAEVFYMFDPETKCWTGVSIDPKETRGIYRFGTVAPFRAGGEWLYSAMEQVSVDGTKELLVARLSTPKNGKFTLEMSDPATPGKWTKTWDVRRISPTP